MNKPKIAIPLKPAWVIAAAVVMVVPLRAWAQNVVPSASRLLTSGADVLSYKEVGLRIDRSNIISEFSGHLTDYVGDCPGSEWTGNASVDNVRFFSYAVPPTKDLRVELVNTTSGKRLIKKYTQEGYGSLDFQVLKLGLGNGPQNIQYRIYNKATDAVLENGNFSYNLVTTQKTIKRDGQWRLELFCATDGSDVIKDCAQLGNRERLYCDNVKTDQIRKESSAVRRF